jgi:hypothetical protein
MTLTLSPFPRRAVKPDEAALALTEATEQLRLVTATLATVGQALADVQRDHICTVANLSAHTEALKEQVQILRVPIDRIDGRWNAFEEWVARMRRAAPHFLGSDPSKAFAAFLAALASHYPPGRDPDAPLGGGRT